MNFYNGANAADVMNLTSVWKLILFCSILQALTLVSFLGHKEELVERKWTYYQQFRICLDKLHLHSLSLSISLFVHSIISNKDRYFAFHYLKPIIQWFHYICEECMPICIQCQNNSIVTTCFRTCSLGRVHFRVRGMEKD